MLLLVVLGGAWPGMVTVETIGRIRRAFWVDKKPPDRARAEDFATDGAQGGAGLVDRVSLRAAGSAATAAWGICRAARRDAGGEQQAAGARAADGAAAVRAVACRGLRRSLRQRAAPRPRLASPAIATGAGIHPAVVRARRGLPVRLVARGGGARRRDDDGQGRAHPALPQPDVSGGR